MEYKDIREIKVFRPHRRDKEVNALLAIGWVIITVDTEEYYGGLGPKDVQEKYLVLGRPENVEPEPEEKDYFTQTIQQKEYTPINSEEFFVYYAGRALQEPQELGYRVIDAN